MNNQEKGVSFLQVFNHNKFPMGDPTPMLTQAALNRHTGYLRKKEAHKVGRKSDGE